MRRSLVLLALALVIVSLVPGCLPFSLGRYGYGRSRRGRQSSSYARRSGSRTATYSDEYVQPRAQRRTEVTYARPDPSTPGYGYAYSQPTGTAYRPYGYAYDQSYVSAVLDAAPSSSTVQSMVVPTPPSPGTVFVPSRERVLVTPQSPARP